MYSNILALGNNSASTSCHVEAAGGFFKFIHKKILNILIRVNFKLIIKIKAPGDYSLFRQKFDNT